MVIQIATIILFLVPFTTPDNFLCQGGSNSHLYQSNVTQLYRYNYTHVFQKLIVV